MSPVRKLRVDVDVTGHAPDGCHVVSTDLFIPPEIGSPPLLWCCVPGGGISQAYFDLSVPPALGEYSMANYLAERGQLILTIDPPGVGRSDLPDDGYQLAPRTMADVLHVVVTAVLEMLAKGGVEGAPALSCPIVLGLGHSAGGLLVACQQGRCGTYAAVSLLGFSSSGLPSVLNEEEAAFTDRAGELDAVLADLVRKRFEDPLPPWTNNRSVMGAPDSPGDAIEAASSKASSRLLAMVGMSALIPGSIKPELDQIDVPTFVGLGDNDIAGDIAALPGQLPSCRDLTLFTLAGAGHNHNVADSRMLLWDRVLRWSASITPTITQK